MLSIPWNKHHHSQTISLSPRRRRMRMRMRMGPKLIETKYSIFPIAITLLTFVAVSSLSVHAWVVVPPAFTSTIPVTASASALASMPSSKLAISSEHGKNRREKNLSKFLKNCQACALTAAILFTAQINYLPGAHDTFSHCHAYDSQVPDISAAADLNLNFADESEDQSPNSRITNNLGLSIPTEERPQIKPPKDLMQTTQSQSQRLKFPSTMSMSRPQSQFPLPLQQSQRKIPIVEGMVYMANPSTRPDPSDILVLTVTSSKSIASTNNADADAPAVILMGAKYPIYKARLPFNFQLYEPNILPENKQLYDAMRSRGDDGDLIVTARVCPEDSVKLPCSADESAFSAKGVGKLLMVPGMDESSSGSSGSGSMVRTPASLSLERNMNF